MTITNITINNAINNQVDIRERTFRSLHKNTEAIEETANGNSQINIIFGNSGPKATDCREITIISRKPITADIIDAMYQGKRSLDIV